MQFAYACLVLLLGLSISRWGIAVLSRSVWKHGLRPHCVVPLRPFNLAVFAACNTAPYYYRGILGGRKKWKEEGSFTCRSEQGSKTKSTDKSGRGSRCLIHSGVLSVIAHHYTPLTPPTLWFVTEHKQSFLQRLSPTCQPICLSQASSCMGTVLVGRLGVDCSVVRTTWAHYWLMESFKMQKRRVCVDLNKPKAAWLCKWSPSSCTSLHKSQALCTVLPMLSDEMFDLLNMIYSKENHKRLHVQCWEISQVRKDELAWLQHYYFSPNYQDYLTSVGHYGHL